MSFFAVIGAKALWLTYLWLASAIIASYLSARKGYGEMAMIVTTGQRVVPTRLEQSGYRFRRPSLEAALRATV